MFDRLTLAGLLGGFAVALTPSLAAAVDPADASPLGAHPQLTASPANTPTTQLKIVSTFVSAGQASNITLVPGFNNLSAPTIVKCTGTTTCTITSNIMGQVSPPAGTLWAVCVLVDGVYATPGCPYQGTLPVVGAFVTGNASFYYVLNPGTHQVTPQIYVSSTSILGEWTMTTTNYK